MIQVGEDSGTLDRTMYRLADFLESQARMRARIQSALAYPLLMTLVGSGVLVFLFVFVIPKITTMLNELDRALPWPTLMLITLTDFLARWWWLLGLLLALALIALKRYRDTERGREHIDSLILKTPLFGRLQLLIVTARFARTLGTLLESGVPLLKALDISRNLLPNRVLNRAIETVTLRVQEGAGLARILTELKSASASRPKPTAKDKCHFSHGKKQLLTTAAKPNSKQVLTLDPDFLERAGEKAESVRVEGFC